MADPPVPNLHGALEIQALNGRIVFEMIAKPKKQTLTKQELLKIIQQQRFKDITLIEPVDEDAIKALRAAKNKNTSVILLTV